MTVINEAEGQPSDKPWGRGSSTPSTVYSLDYVTIRVLGKDLNLFLPPKLLLEEEGLSV